MYVIRTCGEVFLDHDLSELSMCIVAFNPNLLAWQLWHFALQAGRKTCELNSVDGVVWNSFEAISHALRRDMRLVCK